MTDCNYNEEIETEELTVEELEGFKKEVCPAVGYQKVGVSIPVTVRPYANVGTAKTKCCGHPVIIPDPHPCPGRKNEICTFTISQTICVEVPVEFGAVTTVGDTYIDCLGTSTRNICAFCDEHCEE